MMVKATADTDVLDEADAEALRRLVADSLLGSGRPVAARPGRADGFQYDVTLTRDGRTHSLVLHDPLPQAERNLLRWVLASARRR